MAEMTSTGPVRPSRRLPHIDHLPSDNLRSGMATPSRPDALDLFVARTRPWERLGTPLSPTVTAALWTLLAASALVGGWLIAALTGRAGCSGPLCTIATLGNPRIPLALAVSGVVGLGSIAMFTSGLTRANAPQLAVIVVAAVACAASLAGIAAAIVLVAMALALTVLLLLAFLARR